MRKSRLSVPALLSVLMALVLCATALAAGGGGSGGGGGGGKSPLNVVSVQVDGVDLEGSTVAPGAVIRITFDRGMTDNFEANAEQIKVIAGEVMAAAVVAQGDDKSTYTVTLPAELPDWEYTLFIGAGVMANNGSTLGKDFTCVFTVKAAGAPAEEPAEEPGETPVDEPAEEPSETAAEEPAEEPGETPAEEPAEEPGETPAEEPAEEAGEAPAEEPAEQPAEAPAEEPALERAATPPFEFCVLSDWTLVVNGVPFDAQAYNIDGYNYYKLRDIALALNGTANQFSVSWDEAGGVITAVSGEPYVPDGSEQKKSDEDLSATCVPSTASALFNGVPSTAYVYNIGGNNFFKLRDLAAAFGFSVDYDPDARTAIVTTTDYAAPAAE